MKRTINNKSKALCIILLIAVIILSMTTGTKHMSNPSTYKNTINSLNQKTETVTEITGLSAAISTAITALPGDTGTTVADHLMDLNSGLLIVLTALFIEKYLVTLIGKVVFFVLIPAALVIIILGILKSNKNIALKSIKILLISVMLVSIIPLETGLSDKIEKVYNVNLEEVVQSGEDAKNFTEEITETNDENNKEDEEGFPDNITHALSRIADTVTGAITGAVTGALEKGETFLKNLTTALAVLIVTSCIIPLLAIVCIFFAIKWLIGYDFTGVLSSLLKDFSTVQKKTFRNTKNSH